MVKRKMNRRAIFVQKVVYETSTLYQHLYGSLWDDDISSALTMGVLPSRSEALVRV